MNIFALNFEKHQLVRIILVVHMVLNLFYKNQ